MGKLFWPAFWRLRPSRVADCALERGQNQGIFSNHSNVEDRSVERCATFLTCQDISFSGPFSNGAW